MQFEFGLLCRTAVAVLILPVITVLLPLSVGGIVFLALLWSLSLGGTTPPTILTEYWPAFAAGLGLLVLVNLAPGPVRRVFRAVRESLGVDGNPAEETHPEAARRVERLAQQAGVPEPAV